MNKTIRNLLALAAGMLMWGSGLAGINPPPGFRNPTQVPALGHEIKPLPKPTKCLATRVSPNYGSKGDKFTVYGDKMTGCRIQFTGGGLTQPMFAQTGMGNDKQLEAYVPEWLPSVVLDLDVLPVDDTLISASFRFSVSKVQACVLGGMSPTTAQIGDVLTLTGSNLVGCNFYFVNAGGNEFTGNELPGGEASRTRVVVPLDLGLASSAAVSAARGARADSLSQPLLLTLAPPKPVLGQPSPPVVLPNTYLTLPASNIRGNARWVGYFDWKAGGKTYHRQVPVSIVSQDAAKFTAVFKVQVPDMYLDGMGDTRENLAVPKFFTLFRDDKLASNSVNFQLLSPRFILDACNKANAYPGQTISCNGANFNPMFNPYTVWFEYTPGHMVASAVPTWINPTAFYVKVPDVYANQSEAQRKAIQDYTGGKISIAANLSYYGFKHSNALPFHVDRNMGGSVTTQAPRQEDGYNYCGQPSCAGVLGGYLSGKVCCKVEQGSNSPDCGPGHYQYQPDCTNFTTGPGGTTNCAFHPELSPPGCWKSR